MGTVFVNLRTSEYVVDSKQCPEKLLTVYWLLLKFTLRVSSHQLSEISFSFEAWVNQLREGGLSPSSKNGSLGIHEASPINGVVEAQNLASLPKYTINPLSPERPQRIT